MRFTISILQSLLFLKVLLRGCSWSIFPNVNPIAHSLWDLWLYIFVRIGTRDLQKCSPVTNREYFHQDLNFEENLVSFQKLKDLFKTNIFIKKKKSLTFY